MILLTIFVDANGLEKKGFFSDLWAKFLDKVPSIGMAIATFIIGILISMLVIKIINKAMKRAKVDGSASGFVSSLVKIILYIIVITIALGMLGVPMTSIITVIGAAGLAVGLALQSSLTNLAGGFIILFNKPFKSGDFIETNGQKGSVESISILYTKLKTEDGKTVYIPNGIVANTALTNCSQKNITE